MECGSTTKHVTSSSWNRYCIDINIRRVRAIAEALTYRSYARAYFDCSKSCADICSSIALNLCYAVGNLQTRNGRVAESVVANSGDGIICSINRNSRRKHNVARVDSRLVSGLIAVIARICNCCLSAFECIIHSVVISYDIETGPFGSIFAYPVERYMDACIVRKHICSLSMDGACNVGIHISYAAAPAEALADGIYVFTDSNDLEV